MQSEAKRRGNAKYNAKCDQIMVKPLRAEASTPTPWNCWKDSESGQLMRGATLNRGKSAGSGC